MIESTDQPVALPHLPPYAQRLLRYGRSVVFVLAAYAAGMVLLCWLSSAKDVTNELRAAPTLAVFNHIPIYQVGRGNVSFSVLYGPLSYLFHLPAALFPSPAGFFLSGCLISLVLYAAPLIIFFLSLHARPGNYIRAGLLLFTLFALATLNSRSLTLSAMLISPDAAALGFAGAACCVLFFYSDKRQWLDPCLMAAFTCCALFSKQNMIMLVAILPVFALLIGGRRLALRLIACLAAGVLLTVAIVFFVYHDLSAVYFNNVVVPGRFPRQWDHAPRAVHLLYEESSLLLFALACLLLVIFAGARSAVRHVSRRELYRVLLFACMALALVPFSIMGMVFWGGWVNALSPALYFTLLTLLAGSYLLLIEIRFEANVRLILQGVLVVFAVILSPLVAEKFDRASFRAVSPSVMVYRYALHHPGEVYFPFNQVSVFLAERRFYHADWGVMNFYHAGFPFSRDELRKHIPPAARFVAYPPGAPTIAPMAADLAPNHHQAELEGLPGFNIVEIEP